MPSASLFSAATFVRKRLKPQQIAGQPRCPACELYRHCQSPKLTSKVKGKRVLVVGGHPSKADDMAGIPFAGEGGKEFRYLLEEEGGISPRDVVWTYAVACHPSKAATEKQLGHCRPKLMQVIEDVRPEIIIPLGVEAVRGVMAPYWKEKVGSIDAWVGWKIPAHDWNAWVCPLWSSEDFRFSKTNEPRKALQRKYIQEIGQLEGTPWPEGPPNYEAQIETLMDTRQAADRIMAWVRKGGRVAFDFESTTLKPWGAWAKLVCVSICYQGEETIAVPWDQRVAEALKALIQSDNISTVVANIKHEESWCLAKLRASIKNYAWCTLQSGHVCRVTRKTAALKFQSLVRLGQPIFDQHISPYLKAPGTNLPNRIHEIPLQALLFYNGLDSLMAYHVADLQADEAGVIL